MIERIDERTGTKKNCLYLSICANCPSLIVSCFCLDTPILTKMYHYEIPETYHLFSCYNNFGIGELWHYFTC